MLRRLCRSREFRLKLERSRPRLYRLAYAWCHSPELADDLTQEALSKALKRSAQLNDMETMDAWLYRILSNCWHDYLRAKRENLEFDEALHSHQETPEKLSLRLEEILQVREAVAGLNEEQRQVITLVDIEGCSYQAVADIIDIPLGTVMSRLSRARQALRVQLLNVVTPASTRVLPFRRVK